VGQALGFVKGVDAAVDATATERREAREAEGTEGDEEAMMDDIVFLIFVGFGVWLLLFPEGFVAVHRHLRSRYGYATREPKTTIFLRAFGAVWLALLVLSWFRRG
jgi:hypothetical protein